MAVEYLLLRHNLGRRVLAPTFLNRAFISLTIAERDSQQVIAIAATASRLAKRRALRRHVHCAELGAAMEPSRWSTVAAVPQSSAHAAPRHQPASTSLG